VKNNNIYTLKSNGTLVVFLIFINFLGFNFFKKIDYENLILTGSDFISAEEITANSSLKFPTRLISIKTKLIEKELKKNIALKKVSITRQIFPFGLRIFIKKREPIAIAQKIEKGIIKQGFVDAEGVFIEDKYLKRKEIYAFPIKIFGWDENYKQIISNILNAYKNSDDLKEIKLSDGFVTLKEKEFKQIFLGYQPQDIDLKLNLIFDIKKQLRIKNIQKKIKSLDLTDPNNPTLKVFIP